MNILEAIKSGKRFRRKSWTSRNWQSAITFHSNPHEDRLDLPYEAILADDWEVEEIKAPITSCQFDGAWERAAEILVSREEPYETFKTLIKRELGL